MAPEPKRRGSPRHEFLALLICVSLVCCAGGDGMSVALHAQARASKEMVVGSAVTMAGVRQALLSSNGRRNGSAKLLESEGGGSNLADIEIANVSVFYPFEYSGLHDRSWDLVIIEGWFGMINAFIHEVRAISHPRPVTVLFYCLDPEYPGLPHVAALDVEGFLTNSESTRQFLLPAAPTALVPLAVDTEAFPFHPIPPCPSGKVAGGATHKTASEDKCSGEDAFARGGNDHHYGRVVYVGSAGLMGHKEKLPRMLREAAPYGLDIYGSEWQNYPEFSGYWKGVLPEEDLASVYGTAMAVIGVTTDAQRESGKINNRVYEALSVGAPLISDHFPALEATFGDAILYARSLGDVARHIETILRSCRVPGQKRTEADERQRRRAIVENCHTWSQRVDDILSFTGSLPAIAPESDSNNGGGGDKDRSGPGIARCSRQGGCLSLAIVVDRDLDGDITFFSTFVPAVDLLGSAYRVTWWMTPTSWGGDTGDDRTTIGQEKEAGQQRAGGKTFRERQHMQLPRDSDCLAEYDIVWAAGRWGGTADRIVRGLLPRGGAASTRRRTRPRLAAQLTGLVLWGSLCTPADDSPGDREFESPGPGVRVQQISCPDYAGDAGLRWYDVVYCQTRWDHAFLRQQAFEGEVSDNLQEAWGYGTPRKSRFTSLHDSDDEMANSSIQQVDVLVVGTDDQLPDMSEYFKVPGVARVALAVLIPSGAIGVKSVLGTILGVVGVDIGTDMDSLPQRLSLNVGGLARGASATPLGTELLLIRNSGDADTLVRLAASAANVVILASGQLGTWATLLTTSGADDGREGGEQAPGDTKFFVGDEGDHTGTGNRIRDMIEERPGIWDVALYSRRLVAGMTRALCLGRGNSRISLVGPAGGEMVVGTNGTRVTVEVLIDDFDVGRDGMWCVTAEGRTVLCVLQNEFAVDLLISSSATETEWKDVLTTAELSAGERTDAHKDNGEDDIQVTEVAKRRRKFIRIEIATELRSNMYQDVLRRSTPFWLYIDPSGGAIPAFEARAGVYHSEGPEVEWSGAIGRIGSYGAGSVRRDAFQASIDARNFLDRSNIVTLDTTRVPDTTS